MLNVRLVGDHLYGKLLFTWLLLVMSFMVSLCAGFSNEMSWMTSGTLLSQFLGIFLPTFQMVLMLNRPGYNRPCPFCNRTLSSR